MGVRAIKQNTAVCKKEKKKQHKNQASSTEQLSFAAAHC